MTSSKLTFKYSCGKLQFIVTGKADKTIYALKNYSEDQDKCLESNLDKIIILL